MKLQELDPIIEQRKEKPIHNVFIDAYFEEIEEIVRQKILVTLDKI